LSGGPLHRKSVAFALRSPSCEAASDRGGTVGVLHQRKRTRLEPIWCV